MNWFKPVKLRHEWQYRPYGFEPGQKYVIEIDRNKIDMQNLKELKDYFYEHGIIVKLVLTNGKAINPVEVKTYRETSE